jgi:tetratricopeptide (TPR) repeat protein
LPKDAGPEQADQLARGARVLEEVKHYPAAEKLLRKGASLSPAVQWELAEYLARRGQTDEALPLVQQQLKDETLESACRVGMTALRNERSSNGTVQPAHGELVLSWFKEAAKRPKRSPSFLINQALLFDLLSRTEDAVKTYNAVLNLPESSGLVKAMVANNLAYLLAINGGDLAEAEKWSTYSQSQFGAVPEVLDTLAVIALARENHAEAIRLLTEAMEVGGSGEMFFHLALAHQKNEDRTAARQWLDRARQEGLRKEALPDAERRRFDELNAWLKS